MTVYSGYFPHFLSKRLCGTASGARGIAHGFDLCEIEGQRFVADLTWRHNRNAAQDSNTFAFLVHQDGRLVAVVADQTVARVGPLRENRPYNFFVLPVSLVEADTLVQQALVETLNRSDRAELEIAKPSADYADFGYYELYSDQGLGGAVDTQLATLTGYDNNLYQGLALAVGDYVCKARYVDLLGNESAWGADTPHTINPLPKAPTNTALVYTQGARKFTLTGDEPSGQYSYVIGYAIYANWLYGFDLADRLIENREQRLAIVTPAVGAYLWTSFELWPGTWRLAAKALDKWGGESDHTEHVITLEQSGTDLIEVATPPAAPTFIKAEPIVGGDIRVTVKHDDANVTHVRFYRDDAVIATPADTGSPMTYDHTGLVNGTEYEFHCTCLNGATEGPVSETVAAVADSSAPTGTRAITVRMVAQ